MFLRIAYPDIKQNILEPKTNKITMITPIKIGSQTTAGNTASLILTDRKLQEIDEAWTVVKTQVGQFASSRNHLYRDLGKKYGYLTWRLAWQIEEGKYVPFKEAINYYEDSYLRYLESTPEAVDYLVENASDVYDTGPKNLDAGQDYSIQTSRSNHYQDIAIRRALARMGLAFHGDSLIQVRSKSRDKIGRQLSPGRIPFHKPELITNPLRGWWDEGSIEDFWQSNKAVQYNPLLANINPQDRQKALRFLYS